MAARVFDKETRKQIAAMKLRVRRQFAGEGGGAIRARGIGSGHDFYDHKAYAAGDDFRHIDWNLFGRHGDLFVKRFKQETDLEFTVLLDQSASMAMGHPSKDTFARRLACALVSCFSQPAQPFDIRLAKTSGSQVGPRARSESDLDLVMTALEELPAPKGVLASDWQGDGGRTTKNRVIIFLGDFLDGPRLVETLAPLRSERTFLICALVSAKEERDPDIDGKVKMADIEGGGSLSFVVDASMRERYRAFFDAHLKETKKSVLGKGLQYVHLQAEMPLDQAVIALATEGALLR